MHIDHDHVSGGHHHHDHDHHHEHHHHDHDHCHSDCGSCQSKCEHTPMEELLALMKYMANHNAAYEQVMAAVSDFEKGNMRLAMVLKSLEG